MAFDDSNRKWFYDTLNKNGIDAGTYDEFKEAINSDDPSNRQWMYDQLKDKYDLGTFEDMENAVRSRKMMIGGKETEVSQGEYNDFMRRHPSGNNQDWRGDLKAMGVNMSPFNAPAMSFDGSTMMRKGKSPIMATPKFQSNIQQMATMPKKEVVSEVDDEGNVTTDYKAPTDTSGFEMYYDENGDVNSRFVGQEGSQYRQKQEYKQAIADKKKADYQRAEEERVALFKQTENDLKGMIAELNDLKAQKAVFYDSKDYYGGDALLERSNRDKRIAELEAKIESANRTLFDLQKNQGEALESNISYLRKDAERLYNDEICRQGGVFSRQVRAGANPVRTKNERVIGEATKLLDDAETLKKRAEQSYYGGTFIGGALRGMMDAVSDVSTWDNGVYDVLLNKDLNEIFRKHEDGSQSNIDQGVINGGVQKLKAGQSITAEEELLMKAKLANLVAHQLYDEHLGNGYNAGKVTGESLGFMLEMALNPASAGSKTTMSTVGRYVGKGIATRYGQWAVKGGILQKAANYAIDNIDKVVRSGAMALTTGAPRTAAGMYERNMGNIKADIDDYGQLAYYGREDGDDMGTAFMKSLTDNIINNATEMGFGFVGDAGKVVGKVAKTKPVQAFVNAAKGTRIYQKMSGMVDKLTPTEFVGMMNDFEKRTQWHGSFEEYWEEVEGNVLNALTIGDMDFSMGENGVFNIQNNIDTFLGVSLMGGAISTIKTLGYRGASSEAKRRLEEADKYGLSVFGKDRWENMKAEIDALDYDAVDEKGISALTRYVIDKQKEGALTDKGMRAAFIYLRAKEFAKGVETAQGNINKEADKGIVNAINDEIENGAVAETPEDMHKVGIDAGAAEEALLALPNGQSLKDTVDRMIEDGASDGELSAMMDGLTPAEVDAVNNYMTSRTEVEKVSADANKKVNEAYASEEARISPYVHDGQFVTVMVGGQELIVDSMSEDGNYFTVINAEGKPEMISMSDLDKDENGNYIAPETHSYDEYMQQFRNDAEEEIVGDAERMINNNPKTKTEFEGGTTVTFDDNGQYQVIGYNEDNGTYDVALLKPETNEETGAVVYAPDMGSVQHLSAEQLVDMQNEYYDGKDSEGEAQGTTPSGETEGTVAGETEGTVETEGETPGTVAEGEQQSTVAFDEEGEPDFTNAEEDDVVKFFNDTFDREDGGQFLEEYVGAANDAVASLANEKEKAMGDIEKAKPKASDFMGKLMQYANAKKQWEEDKSAAETEWQKKIDDAQAEADRWKSIRSKWQQGQVDAAQSAQSLAEFNNERATLDEKDNALGDSQSLEEFVARQAYTLRYLWKDNGTKKGLASELFANASQMDLEGERVPRMRYLSNTDGVSVGKAAEIITQRAKESGLFGEDIDDADIRNMLIDALKTYNCRGAVLRSIADARLANEKAMMEQYGGAGNMAMEVPVDDTEDFNARVQGEEALKQLIEEEGFDSLDEYYEYLAEIAEDMNIAVENLNNQEADGQENQERKEETVRGMAESTEAAGSTGEGSEMGSGEVSDNTSGRTDAPASEQNDVEHAEISGNVLGEGDSKGEPLNTTGSDKETKAEEDNQGNPIDSEENAVDPAEVVIEMNDADRQYIDEWKDRINKSVKTYKWSLKSVLTNGKKSREKAISDWEDTIREWTKQGIEQQNGTTIAFLKNNIRRAKLELVAIEQMMGNHPVNVDESMKVAPEVTVGQIDALEGVSDNQKELAKDYLNGDRSFGATLAYGIVKQKVGNQKGKPSDTTDAEKQKGMPSDTTKAESRKKKAASKPKAEGEKKAAKTRKKAEKKAVDGSNEAVSAAFDELKDVLAKFKNAGKNSGRLYISLVGLTPEQMEMLGELFDAAAKFGYQVAKAGKRKLDEWTVAMKSMLGDALADATGWTGTDADDFFKEVWDTKYSVDGVRRSLGEHVLALEKAEKSDPVAIAERKANDVGHRKANNGVARQLDLFGEYSEGEPQNTKSAENTEPQNTKSAEIPSGKAEGTVAATERPLAEPKGTVAETKAPEWRYSLNIGSGGATIHRGRVMPNGAVVEDGRYEVHGKTPEELMAIIMNPANGIESLLDEPIDGYKSLRVKLEAAIERKKQDDVVEHKEVVNGNEEKDVTLQREESKADETVKRSKESAEFSRLVASEMLGAVSTGEKPFKSIVDLRKRARECGMEVDENGATDILLQELVEDGLVAAARDMVASNRYGGVKSKSMYDAICKLYDMQPTISMRSSNRIMMQQYSTPLPMAFVADMFADGAGVKSILEPTAGNGMLVSFVPVEKVYANELDTDRLANLREQGFAQVTNQDATQSFGGTYDAVIMNPPFGSAKAKDYDGTLISGLDPQIVLNALENMSDDGKASIIIGGNLEYGSNGAIKGKKAFFAYLYDHYNVKGIVDMDGDLYKKQGTSYPTMMIFIDGRRSAEERAQTVCYPPVKDKSWGKVLTFEELYQTVEAIINDKQKTDGTEMVRSQEWQPVSDVQQDSTGGGNVRTDNKKHRANDAERGGKRGQDVSSASSDSTDGVLRKAGQAGLEGKQKRSDGNNGNRSNGGRGRKPVVEGVSGNGVSGQRVGLEKKYDTPSENIKEAKVEKLSDSEERNLTQEKMPYKHHSNAFSLQSVAPSSMVEAMDENLSQIEKEYGSVDEFVTKELGYETVEQAHNALAAEQMDSVAMAIAQMKKGNAIIIGDQTGVGKGRQMAALVRWACKQGKKPIFVTQKADLFSDIYRDLVDIGSGELRPFIFNSDGAMVDANGKKVHTPLSSQAQAKIFEGDELPEEYDFAVVTYSQMNNADAISLQEADASDKEESNNNTNSKGGRGYKKSARSKNTKAVADGSKPTPKATFLRRLAQDNYMFLDESHTAAGASNMGLYFQSILKTVKACTFASATYSKTPATMALYALKTAMSEANISPKELIGVIEKGGVTLQEIMARALSKAGQMVRRERDMRNVITDWVTIDDAETVKFARENYDKTIEVFNDIIDFQKTYIDPNIEELRAAMAIKMGDARKKKGTDKMGIENVPFASKTYAYTKQLMLALKANAIADKVEEEIKQGRHPVIALENTMESNITEFNDGDVIDTPTFAASMMRGLKSTLKYTVETSEGQKLNYSFDVKKLGPVAEKAYNDLEQKILENTKDIFISPLDAIINELQKRGYKVGELTGRSTCVEIDASGQAVARKRTDTDKKSLQRRFNSGELDVLILNKSASTGISLHASEKFADQRQRTMIIAQPLSDINDYMQMIGRVDRTGQVHRGYYINLGLPVPAENRFLMMLSTKLKSLNANTTTAQDSESNDVEAPDLLNKYGSRVIVEYLRDHVDIYEKMGNPFKFKLDEGSYQEQLDKFKSDEDTARKVTGYVALLSTKEQEEFYNDVVQRYTDLINYLNDTGENDLKITTMPLRAQTIASKVTSSGKNPEGDNPFAKDAFIEQVEMDVLRKPMKNAEVQSLIKSLNDGKTDNERIVALQNKVLSDTEAKIEAENERYDKAVEKFEETFAKVEKRINANMKLKPEEKAAEIERQRSEMFESLEKKHKGNIASIRNNAKIFHNFVGYFKVGEKCLMPDNLESMMFSSTSPAAFCGIKAKDKMTPSTTFAVFAVLDGRRKLEIPLSNTNLLMLIKQNTMQNYDAVSSLSFDNWDEQIPTTSRKKGYIMTGNILQAVADTQDKETGAYVGQLVSYTDIDGNIHDGILMPDNWTVDRLKGHGSPISSAYNTVMEGGSAVSVDNSVEIRPYGYGTYELYVPKSVKQGGKYFKNEDILNLVERGVFNERGNRFRATVKKENVRKLLDVLDGLGVKAESKEEGDEVRFRRPTIVAENGLGVYGLPKTVGMPDYYYEALKDIATNEELRNGRNEIVKAAQKAYKDFKNKKGGGKKAWEAVYAPVIGWRDVSEESGIRNDVQYGKWNFDVSDAKKLWSMIEKPLRDYRELLVANSYSQSKRFEQVYETAIDEVDYAISYYKAMAEGIDVFDENWDKPRFARAWHGSAADFDKFDLAFAFTGEGSMANGYGVYVAELKGTGERYASIAANTYNGNRGKAVYVDGKLVNRNTAEYINIASNYLNKTAGDIDDAVGRIEYVYKLNNAQTPNENAETRQARKAVELLKSGRMTFEDKKRMLYEIEIPDDNGSNYLNWDGGVPKSAVERILKHPKLEGWYLGDLMENNDSTSGKYIVKALEAYFTPKEVSAILSDSGFVGTKVPTGYNSGRANAHKGNYNYVVFNEDDVKIVSKTAFSGGEIMELNHSQAEMDQMEEAVKAMADDLKVPVKVVRSHEEIDGIGGLSTGSKETLKRDGKGLYNTVTGEVVINLAKNADAADACKTVLHEVVGHKGLRQIVGEKEYDRFLAKVYKSLPAEERSKLNERASKEFGWDVYEATDEMLAEMAERDEVPSWWDKVVAEVRGMLRRFGWRLDLDENDVRYLLWQSKNRLRKGDIVSEAESRVMRRKLGINRVRESLDTTRGDKKTKGETSETVANTSDKKDARFSFIGQRAVKDRKTKTKNEIYLNLQKAKRMEKKYKSELNVDELDWSYRGDEAWRIKLATGWEKGADGKWRYEFTDFGITPDKVRSVLEDKEAYYIQDGVETYMLSDFIGNKNLFSFYNKLKYSDVIIEKKDGQEYTGRYDAKFGDIQIVYQYGIDGFGKRYVDYAKMAGTLVHELQHAIQDIEGFAFGGNLESLSYDEYRRLAGEVEARNATRRMSLTTKERRERLADDTSDVNLAEQIVSYDGEVSLSLVTDKARIEWFDNQPKIVTYKTVAVDENGEIHAPMADNVSGTKSLKNKVKTGNYTFGDVLEAEEHPELADEKGKIKIQREDGKTLDVAYDPYDHSSDSMINDQFKSAWERDNLVVIRQEIPLSEVEGENRYHAEKALLPVGKHNWKKGAVGNKLSDADSRHVYLSRWSRPIERVDWQEVADEWIDKCLRNDIDVPFNVVPEAIRDIIADAGVNIIEPEKGMGKNCFDAYEEWKKGRPTDPDTPDGGGRNTTAKGGMKAKRSDMLPSYGEVKNIISKVIDKIRKTYKEAKTQFEYEAVVKEFEDIYKPIVPMKVVGEMTTNIELFFDGLSQEDRNIMLEMYKKGEFMGGYSPELGKIIIFANSKFPAHELLATLYHENVHAYLESVRKKYGNAAYNELVSSFYNSDVAQSVFNNEFMTTNHVDKNGNKYYEDDERPEEFFVRAVESCMYYGDVSSILEVLPDKHIKYINEYLNLLGYGKSGTKEVRMEIDEGSNGKSAQTEGRGFKKKRAIVDSFEDGTDIVTRDKGAAREMYERSLTQGTYKFQEAWQDSMLGLRTLMESVMKSEGKTFDDVADWENAYMAENLMSSVNQAEFEAYRSLLYSPMLKIVDDIQKLGASYEDIKKYLVSKHGIERNDVFAMRDARKVAKEAVDYDRRLADLDRQLAAGDIDEEEYNDSVSILEGELMEKLTPLYEDNRMKDYSGLTQLYTEEMDEDVELSELEARAQQFVDDFEASYDQQDDVKLLWDAIRACNEATLSKQLESGMMDQVTYDQLKDMFEYYIPLRGFDDTTSDEIYDYLRHSQSPMNEPIKAANGRKSLADDPIATIGNMAESGIMAGNRNLMKQKFLSFAENHPSDALSISDVHLKKESGVGGDEWVAIGPEYDKNDSPHQIDVKRQEFESWFEAMRDEHPDEYKMSREIPNMKYRTLKQFMGEHNVIVKRGGKQYVITVNANPRAAQAINGLTNPHGTSNKIIQGLEATNRFLASMFTNRNPAFVIANLCRDGVYSNSLVWVKESPTYARRYNANWVMLVAKSGSLVSKYKQNKLDMDVPLEKDFHDFIMNGGETGFTSLNSVDEYRGMIQDALSNSKRGVLSPKKAFSLVDKGLDTFNRWAEDTSRFAAYLTSRQMGRSIARSVYDAKEISVNFNKKGAGSSVVSDSNWLNPTLSQTARELYIFFNAGVQGMANIMKAAKKSPALFTAMGANYFLIGALMPAVGVLLSAMCGGDDDDYWDIPEYIRRNNLCICFGKYTIKIPLPIELRMFYGLGELASGQICGYTNYQGKETTVKIAEQMSQVMPLDMMEGDGGLATFIPSYVKPVYEIVVNKDWTGVPIEKRNDYNTNMPNWTKAYKGSSPMLVGLAKAVNEWTGGDNRKKGAVDLDPAWIEHLWQGYFGGLGTTASQTLKTFEMPFNEDVREMRNVPIANRFLASSDSRAEQKRINSEYYSNKEKMDEFGRLFNGYKQDMNTSKDPVEVAEYKTKYSDMLKSDDYTKYMQWKALQKVIKKLEDVSKQYDGSNEKINDKIFELKKRMNEMLRK